MPLYQKFYEDKFGYTNPILGKLGVTHEIGRWLVGKPVVDFLFALIELFAIYYDSGAIGQHADSSAVFTGGRPLCAQILPGQGRRPSTILGIRKLQTVKTASCVPSF